MKRLIIVGLLAALSASAMADTNLNEMAALENALAKPKSKNSVPDTHWVCSHTADNGFVQPDIPLVLTYWGANRAVMFSPSGDTGDIFIFVTEDSLSHGVYDVSRQAAISLTKEDANTAAVIYKTAQDTLTLIANWVLNSKAQVMHE